MSRGPRSAARAAAAAALLVALVMAQGCATLLPRRARGVPIDQRPTPTLEADTTDSSLEPPPPATPPRSEPVAADRTETPTPSPRPSVESVMTPEERREALTRIVADTTAASASVKKCSTRTLLPDQESVYETTRGLLAQIRSALARDEVWRAESLARKARQLASSLSCP